MGTEVEHASGHIQTTAATSSSTTSTSSPKVSLFSKKSGFVIPKNKLSGSLVPVFRGTKKGDADLLNEEAGHRVQRKTKWGPDLTLDTSVRKGRVLAYQTRIDQISHLLTVGAIKNEDHQDFLSTSQFDNVRTSDHQLSHEELELLELEKREIIGEMLKLNPSYKAPSDYKPLLKEANVPIPVKNYPGYNFVGIIFGPASDTQKRLEKETGAKMRVYGTKTDTGVKVEVTPDEKEVNNHFEDMYVHVSADTCEKIDAAVALIELLVTPVSVNPVSSAATSTEVSDENVSTHMSRSMPSSFLASASIKQGIVQPYTGSVLPPPQGHFQQYPRTWFTAGPTQTPFLQSGQVFPANSSSPLLSNAAQVSSSPYNSPNMPSLFGHRPVIPASFSPVMQNPSLVPSTMQLTHAPQSPYMQQAPPLGQTGGPRNTPPVLQPASQGLNNLMAMPPPAIHSQGHNNMVSQNIAVSAAPSPSIPSNMISPLPGPFQPSGAGVNQPSRGGFSPSAIPHLSSGPVQPSMTQVSIRAPSPSSMPGPARIPFLAQSSSPLPQPGIPNSFSGSAPNFGSTRPISAAIPRPQQPSSSDFTFRPQRPPNAASQVAWQSSLPAHQNITPPVQGGQAPLASQSPFSRPLVHNLNLSPVQGFPRPKVSQINHPRAQIPANFPGSLTGPPVPPRHPALPGPMQPRNFMPPRPVNNPSGPFPPRAESQMHIQQHHPPRPQRFPVPRQHFGNSGMPFSNPAGAQQIYDPFSPTAAFLNNQMGGNAAKVQSESDPEYEDLMASVGVK